MGITTININAADFSVIKINEQSTDCSTIYTYRIIANQNDNIDIVLSGNHLNESYTLNNIKSSFTDNINLNFNNNLTFKFSIANSGVSGSFNSVDITVTNNTTSATTNSFSFTDTRENDSVLCEDTVITEQNDLTSIVTWDTVPDAFISQSSIKQHESSLQITESQISDLEHFSINNRIVVTEASQLQNIDSSKVYLIDGFIDMGTQQIEVPSGGIFIKGLDYFVSGLFSTADNYTMFINAAGQAAGNVRSVNLEYFVSGVNSKLLNLDNQSNNGSIEFLSCNFGRFSGETTSLGNLNNYRQFRTDDVALIRVADGIEFNGTWSGGFAITSTILLSIPANTTIFKEGTLLDFQGSSISDLNAVSVDDTAIIFNFIDTNFSRDEGFKLNSARFKIGTNPIPNIGFNTTKKLFKDCSGIKNTFPGGRWEVTTQTVTPLSLGIPAKALGTTTYDDLVHFSQTTDNAFIYDSTIEKDFIVTGQLIVDGGANDEIDVIIRQWDDSAGTYIDIRTFTRNISNLLGGLDIAYFDPYASVTLNENDRIEIWLRNNTDNDNATLLDGSFIAINVRN